MPRLDNNKGRRGASGVLEGDVRLTDYAHANLPSAESSRVSKKAVYAGAKSIRETRHWWECDEDDLFDDLVLSGAANQDGEEDEEFTDDDEEQLGKNINNGGGRRRNRFKKSDDDIITESIRYPIDLWYLISEYIRPEDVGRFALVCRQAYTVTRGSRFWRHLYRRFCDTKLLLNVPDQFRPLALRRPYGLRTRVIKALYYSYGHFTERSRCSNGISLSSTVVEKLYRGLCESTWWEQHTDSVSGKTQWRFYFKFCGRRLSSSKTTSLSKQGRVKNAQHHYNCRPTGNTFLDYLDDTWANLEDDCSILKVTCNQYTQIPIILGWRLSDFNISLCSDMRSHRLRLIFTEGGAIKTTKGKISGIKEVAVLDNVQTVSVFDWWHPNYPSAVL